jgi:hypothetical protein
MIVMAIAMRVMLAINARSLVRRAVNNIDYHAAKYSHECLVRHYCQDSLDAEVPGDEYR